MTIRYQITSFMIAVFAVSVVFSCATLRNDTEKLEFSPVSPGSGSLVRYESLFLRPSLEWKDLLSWASPAFLSSQFIPKNLLDSGYENWRLGRIGAMHDVQAIRIVFDTVLVPSPNAESDRQSGLLVLPAATRDITQKLTWVIWTKGTDLVRSDAPSAYAGFESRLAALLASLGFAVWMPDYAGFGESPGIQTYCVPESQALSAMDGFKAARNVLSGFGGFYGETGNLVITGYSQGGLAAIASARRFVEHRGDFPGLTLKTVWALGAPLDLMIGARGGVDPDIALSRPEYTVYLVLGWARAYPERIVPGDILRPDVLEKAVPLFDGTRDNDVLHEAVAKAVGRLKGTVRYRDIFLASYLDAMGSDPGTVPYFALQSDARLDRWIPPSGTKLVFAGSMRDVVVDPKNSVQARDWILSRQPDADVSFVELYSGDHARGGAEALLYAILRIDQEENKSGK